MATNDSGQQDLGQQIMEAVRQQTGQNIVAAATDDLVILSGIVPSRRDHRHAATIAAALAGERRVDNELEIEQTLPPGAVGYSATGQPIVPAVNEPADDDGPIGDRELDGDFMDQPLDSNPDDIPNPSVVDYLPDPEADPVYFPPTDPVLTANAAGNMEVLNGFAPTADDDLTAAPSTLDDVPGDEALEEAIQRELRQDAATTDLRISVVVREGVAHLHGTVPGLDDAENAEDVAARIPGVVDVIEELNVEQL
jgi:osmotically-inducible protein OsmY